MVSKKSRASQGGIREFRSAVAKLKAAGLVSARVDARSQRETKYMRAQVRKFADVVAGNAKTVKVPKAIASEYKEGGRYKTKGRTVVVPVEDKKERIRYDKKSGLVTGSSNQYGARRTKEYRPKPIRSSDDAKALPQADNVLYTIPLGKSYRTFDTFADLMAMITQYERIYNRGYANWQDYVIVERIGSKKRRVVREADDGE